jgi:hypothetical protein
MARKLGKGFYIEHRIKLPNGGCVWGLRIQERKARRIKRAREKVAFQRELASGE